MAAPVEHTPLLSRVAPPPQTVARESGEGARPDGGGVGPARPGGWWIQVPSHVLVILCSPGTLPRSIADLTSPKTAPCTSAANGLPPCRRVAHECGKALVIVVGDLPERLFCSSQLPHLNPQ